MNPPSRPRPSFRAAALLALGLVCAGPALLACSRPAADRVVRLVHDSDVVLVPGPREGDGWRVEELEDGWIQVHESIAPDAVQPTAWPQILTVPLSFPFPPPRVELRQPYTLTMDGEPLSYADIGGQKVDPTQIPAGMFTVIDDLLLFKLDADGLAPGAKLEFSQLLPSNSERRVGSTFGTWDGFCLFPGDRLRIGNTARAVDGELLMTIGALASSRTGEGLRFRMRDGETVLWEHSADPMDEEFHRFRLPAELGGVLEVDVQGARGAGLVLNPRLRPAGLLEEDAAAVVDPRPDIVLFLADTLRADVLAPWGKDPELAPEINAFFAESLYFHRAWTPATWTLPSQTSMLSGIYPYQHRVIRGQRSLPALCTTVAEVLSRRGYRTAAVTEGLLVSARYGLDQGFESFRECDVTRLDQTLEQVRGVLERDDGRPLFLFVQTYRAHGPYRVSDRTRERLPELFGEITDPELYDFHVLQARVHAAREKGADSDEYRQACRDFERLYLGGVADLDLGFGTLRDMLAEFGMQDAPFVFASDHGEGFGRHGYTDHGNSVFEELARIPLAIRDPRLAPGERSYGASLLDIGPTICALANLEEPDEWEGTSLLTLDVDRPQYVFECTSKGKNPISSYGIVLGDRKLVGRMSLDGESFTPPHYVYDLAGDPVEANPADPDADSLTGYLSRFERLLTPLHDPEHVPLSSAELEALKDMGYTGED